MDTGRDGKTEITTAWIPSSKAGRWWHRNVKKDLPPTKYFDGVDAALREAGLV